MLFKRIKKCESVKHIVVKGCTLCDIQMTNLLFRKLFSCILFMLQMLNLTLRIDDHSNILRV